MKRYVTAAIAFEDIDSTHGQLLGRNENIRGPGIAPKRDYRRVLKEQKHVANLPGLAQFDKFLLQTHAFGVVERAEVDDRDHFSIVALGDLRCVSP